LIAVSHYYRVWVWDPIERYYPASLGPVDHPSDLGTIPLDQLNPDTEYVLYFLAFNYFSCGPFDVLSESIFRSYDYIMLHTGQLSVDATVNIDPDLLNLKSKGRWITAYIELPEGYDTGEIDTATISLKKDDFKVGGEYSELQTNCLMVKFPRSEVQGFLEPGDIELTVSGKLTGGMLFEGTDTIRVIDKGGKK